MCTYCLVVILAFPPIKCKYFYLFSCSDTLFGYDLWQTFCFRITTFMLTQWHKYVLVFVSCLYYRPSYGSAIICAVWWCFFCNFSILIWLLSSIFTNLGIGEALHTADDYSWHFIRSFLSDKMFAVNRCVVTLRFRLVPKTHDARRSGAATS